jgi:uncharacterized protein DUF6438
MSEMRFLALVVLAGCWTGGDTTPRSPDPGPDDPLRPRASGNVDITLERHECYGGCPVFKLAIHADGRVEWLGEANVAAIGTRERTIAISDVAVLDHQLDVARVFERDKFGQIPQKPTCVRSGNSMTCSMSSSTSGCSDTSHSVFTIVRDGKRQVIDDSHCSDEDTALDELEKQIITRARAREWIGR